MGHFATRLRRLAAVATLVAIAFPAPARGVAEADDPAVRGLELLGAGRHAEAAASLEKALEAEPSSEPLRAALARALAALAVGHAAAGRLPESRDTLERAVSLAPGSAEYRALLARVLFRQGDLRGARREVDEALELDPGSPEARELSGDLYDREGLLNRAVADWEEASVARGSHVLARKIERGRREMAVEEGMERETSRRFLVLHEPQVPRELVRGILALLDEAFDVLHDRLGDYPRDEIKVILSSRASFRDVTRMPDWAGGAYDGKIRVPVGGLATVAEAVGLLNILVHEMTHAFLYRMAPEGLPRWLHEGLATTFQGWDPAAVRAWLAEHPPEGLASLADADRWLQGRGGSVDAGYAAARLAVAEMEELRGFGALRRIIAGVGEGRPFPEAFLDEMRLELAEFEARWSKGLR